MRAGGAGPPRRMADSRAMTVPAALPRYRVGPARIRYYLNWLGLVPLTAVLGAAGIFVSFFDHGGRLTTRVARAWARLVLRWAGIRLRVVGLEHLDLHSSYVFVANHHSALDIPALLVALPCRLLMMAKASLFRIPFLGWYMARVGYVPVAQGEPRSARRTLRRAVQGAGRGASMVVFPEGTRTPEGSVAAFKRGAVFLAREAGLPIVPVAIVNSGHLLPRGEFRADPGEIEVRVGAPIHPDSRAPTRILAVDTRARVTEMARGDRARPQPGPALPAAASYPGDPEGTA